MIADPYSSVVTTPAASRDLTTKADVKIELGLTGSADDAWLDRAVTAASLSIAAYCKREFVSETLTDKHRFLVTNSSFPRPIEGIRLGRRPGPANTGWATTITSVVEDGVTLASSAYELILNEGKLLRLDSAGGLSLWAASQVTIVYSSGYPSNAIPLDLANAAIEVVKVAWFGRQRDPMIKSEENPGVFKTEYVVGVAPGDDDDLPASAIRYLGRYLSRGC